MRWGRQILVVAALCCTGSLVSAAGAQARDGKPVTTQRTADGGTVLNLGATRGELATAGGLYWRDDAPASVRAAAHWGHVHLIRRYSRHKTRKIIELFEDSADVTALVGTLVGAVTESIGTAVAGVVNAFGFTRISRAFSRALAKSRKQPAVRLDIGLRCAHVPYLPDPCWPAMWIRPRR